MCEAISIVLSFVLLVILVFALGGSIASCMLSSTISQKEEKRKLPRRYQ